MDLRTADLLDALDPVAVSLLLQLVDGPGTEAELLGAVSGPSQSTINRRLFRLEKAGLVAQENGKRHATRRCWALVHAPEVETLLVALLNLASAVDLAARSARDAERKAVLRARAARLQIREVGGGET